MEYVKERGTFDDVPFEEMMRVLEETYGKDIGSAQDGSDTIFQA